MTRLRTSILLVVAFAGFGCGGSPTKALESRLARLLIDSLTINADEGEKPHKCTFWNIKYDITKTDSIQAPYRASVNGKYKYSDSGNEFPFVADLEYRDKKWRLVRVEQIDPRDTSSGLVERNRSNGRQEALQRALTEYFDKH